MDEPDRPALTAPPFPDRILVYGVTGSGKSTFASDLARALGRDWVSVDDLTWLPGWIAVPDDEQRRIFAEICARDRWLLDTAYGKWRGLAEERVQLIIALDYPRLVSLRRLLCRTIHRALSGRPICNGNRESLRLALSRDSILAWHFKSFQKKRDTIRAWERSLDPGMIIILRSPAEARRLLAEARNRRTGGL